MLGTNAEAVRYIVRIYERILRSSNCIEQIKAGKTCDRRQAFSTGRCAAVISLPGNN